MQKCFSDSTDAKKQNDENIIKSKSNLGVYNSQIKEIYGNYGFWSWFQFWFMDSVFKQTVMLMDKTRIDYDYKKGESVRRSNNPSLQRDIDKYNATEAVEFLKKRQQQRQQEKSREQLVEEMRDKVNKNNNKNTI